MLTRRLFSSGGPTGATPPPNPEPPLPPGTPPPAPATDPNAAIAELKATVAAMPAMIAQQLQAALHGNVADEPPPDNDWPTIQQGWLELKNSKNPADRALAAALENQARNTARLEQELATERAERQRMSQVMQHGIPAEDVAACQKYLESGDAGNMKAAHRLVMLDKQEAAAKGAVAATTPGATVPPPTSPAAPRPSPASPAVQPAGPTFDPNAPIKQAEYERLAAENVNGRPTKRALEIVEAVKSGRIVPVPG